LARWSVSKTGDDRIERITTQTIFDVLKWRSEARALVHAGGSRS
jgi:hypothetical protein